MNILTKLFKTAAPLYDGVVSESAESILRKTAVPEDYDALAKKIGIVARIGSRVDLLQGLTDEGISVLSLASVEAYLDKKGSWKWFPLRIVDQQHYGYVLPRATATKYPFSYGYLKAHPYSKPIPYPVLLTVEKLVARFGSEIQFYVAAIDDYPDPFLGCMLKGGGIAPLVVIERWDEPSFRG